MTIFWHELRRGRTALVVWTAAIALLIAVCVLIYPDMAEEMDTVSQMFANMGAFSAAFGMDQLSFGTLTGFFAIECGNILGLGGALFAGLLGIAALAREEQEGTAGFLLTHPVSRARVAGEKLAAALAQVVLLNAVTAAVAALSILAIGEDVDGKAVALMLLAYFLLQVELCAVTFGLSACLRRNSLGVGLGVGALAYFLNLIANLTDKAEGLKYLTPFSYAEGAYIVEHAALPGSCLAAGAAFTAAGLALAFWAYRRKDILA